MDVAQNVGTPRISYERSVASLSIRVHAPAGAEVKVTRAGPDLLLSFPQAAPPFDISDLQRRAADLLEGIGTGHDAVLLRLAPGVSAQVETTASTTTITLSAPAPDQPPAVGPDAAIDPEGTFRLDLLRARLLLSMQQLREARRQFEALRSAMPEAFEPVAGLAAVEQQAGRWRRSAQRYREASGLAGGDAAMLRAASDIERSRGDQLRADLERRKSRGGNFSAPVDLTLVEVRGFRRLGPAWAAGIDVDSADVDTSAVQRSSGAVTPFSGRRNRAELFAQHDAMDGNVTVGSIFVGEGTGGVGVSRRRPDDRGATSFALDLRRHNWDYVEGIVERAVRDRAEIGRLQRLATRLTGRVLLAYNRYGVRNDDDVARTVSLGAEVRLSELAGVAGLAAAYQLEAEYVDRLATRSTPSNASLSPLPLVDREVHAALIGYARSSGDRDAGGLLSVDAYGGLGVDRYGRSGSVAFAALAYGYRRIEMRLRAGRVTGISQARASTSFVGAQLSLGF